MGCTHRSRTVFNLLLHSQKSHKLVASCLFYRLVATCQQVTTSLSISSNCNKSFKTRLVATWHLQTCYNLLKQVATIASPLKQSTCNKSVDNLQQACWQIVTDLLSQAVAHHANASWYRLVVTSYCKMSTDLLQLACFWLCIYVCNHTLLYVITYSHNTPCKDLNYGLFISKCTFQTFLLIEFCLMTNNTK